MVEKGLSTFGLQGSPPPTSVSSPAWPSLGELLVLPDSLEEADPDDLAAAEEAARALHRTLSTEVVSVLGVTLMFGDTDGDS